MTREPNLTGGRTPKDAPKPRGHHRVNGLLIIGILVAVTFFLRHAF